MIIPKTAARQSAGVRVPSAYSGRRSLLVKDPAITGHAAMDGGQGLDIVAIQRPENRWRSAAIIRRLCWRRSKPGLPQMQCSTRRKQASFIRSTSASTRIRSIRRRRGRTIYGNGNFGGDRLGEHAGARRNRRPGQRAGLVPPYYDITATARSSRRDATSSSIRWSSASSPDRTGGIYSVIPNQRDGSVWGAVPGPMPRPHRPDRSEHLIGEAYEPPFNNRRCTASATRRAASTSIPRRDLDRARRAAATSPASTGGSAAC